MSFVQASAISPNGVHPASDAKRRPRRKRFWLWALLQQRCPRCREGRIFRGAIAMNDPCPVCGLVFNREPGYFLGAMYFSYALGVLILIPIFYLLQWVLPGWSGIAVAFLAMIPYVPLMGVVFRYSRVLWIYFDRHNAASELPAPPRP